MTFKGLSKDELTVYLTEGIPLPKSAMTDENTIDFYFEELLQFINIADNNYWAKSSDYLEITITVDDEDFLILRYIAGNVMIYLVNRRPDILETMTPEEASDVVGMIYGIVVYNEKWVQVNELVEEFTEELVNKLEYNATKAKVKMDPKLLAKLNKSPIQTPDKVLKMSDYRKYFKKGNEKDYK